LGPSQARHWYDALLPIAQRGGPVLTLALLIAMCLSTWWLTSWVHDCVDRNRQLTERLMTQQQALMQELRLSLAHCQPER
jgi:hypothetical protein